MEREETRKNWRDRDDEIQVIIIILLIFILLLIIFWIIRNLGTIEHKFLVPTGSNTILEDKIPTGNVDIYDITFGNNCCNICEEPDYPLGGVDVYDDDTFYSTKTKLNIFTQTSYYVVDDKIAPTSENSYQFVIRNNNDFSIGYSVEMSEINNYNINMKYRLKLNGVYVVGNDNHYVTASELKQYNLNLSNNSYDVYTLDWKWFESSNDTAVGSNINSNYELDIHITAYAY